jgi:hypothetical protein
VALALVGAALSLKVGKEKGRGASADYRVPAG